MVTDNVWNLIEKLDKIVDESDPDNNLPQIVHAYQTAEKILEYFENGDINGRLNKLEIRKIFDTETEWLELPQHVRENYEKHGTIQSLYADCKEMDWLPLIGLIHDLGKIIMLDEYGKMEQFASVGDTFVVGAPISTNFVYSEKGYFENNPDSKNEKYNKSKFGMYKENIGFDNVHMSWGHDEFLAHALQVKNKTSFPPEAFYVVRFHSFYAWHTCNRKQRRGYEHFASDFDWKMLPMIKLFQIWDLYSKSADIPEIKDIKKKYQPLIDKYMPNPCSL